MTKEMYDRAKPILFSTEMVQAILGGRKTQTRRVGTCRLEAGDILQEKSRTEDEKMTYDTIIAMIDEYIAEPNEIRPEWVKALLIVRKLLVRELAISEAQADFEVRASEVSGCEGSV